MYDLTRNLWIQYCTSIIFSIIYLRWEKDVALSSLNDAANKQGWLKL